MKKSQQPTLAQAGYIRDTAIELGPDDGTWARVLRELRDQVLDERDNCITVEFVELVDQNRDYNEALEAAGPDTPGNYNVRKVGYLYLSVSDEMEEVTFVLRNFPKGGGSWDKALAWAEAKGYKPTNPREGFAVAEQYNLKKPINCDWIYIVATTECDFDGYRQAVCVGVDESDRVANLNRLENFGNDNDWFLFRNSFLSLLSCGESFFMFPYQPPKIFTLNKIVKLSLVSFPSPSSRG